MIRLLLMLTICTIVLGVDANAQSSGSRVDKAVNTGVFVHGDEMYVSGVIQAVTVDGNAPEVREEEEREERELREAGPDDDDMTIQEPSWDQEEVGVDFPVSTGMADPPETQSLMDQGQDFGRMSLLETGEGGHWDDLGEVADATEAATEAELEMVDPIVKETKEKAALAEAAKEAADEDKRLNQQLMKDPNVRARVQADKEIKEVTAEEKAKVKKFDQDAQKTVAKEQKELKEKRAANDKLQSEDFRDDPSAKKFISSGKDLAADWDKEMNATQAPVKVPDTEFRGGSKNHVNGNTTRPTPIPWSVKIGMVKNFAPNPETARTRSIASLKDLQALDVFQLKQKQVGIVVHGNQLSRVDLKSGRISPMAGSPTAGNVDGTGANAQFDQPKDVAVFSDPKSPDTWMALVADSENDQLRLVKDPLGTAQVSTVLEKAMVEAPQRIAVVESRQVTPDMLSSNHKRKVFAFLICGKNTVVRVENILGRRNVTSEALAYESSYEKKLRDRDKEIYNENTRATVHMISSKFMHLSDIAVAKQQIDGGENIVLFVVDQKAGLLFRLDDIIEGERQARVIEVANVHSHVSAFLSVQSGESWFGISGGSIPAKEEDDVKLGGKSQRIYRVDQVVEGEKEGETSALHSLNQEGRIVSMAAMANWGGKVYFAVDGLKGDSTVFELDASHPLVCKDKTMLGSTEFNELGELEKLGLVQVETKDVNLRSWVAMGPLKSDKVDWRVVAFRADEGRVCGVSNIMKDVSAGVYGYHCTKGMCFPS